MSADLQLANALRACGVTITDDEMRDPARLKIVLQQVRKSVRMCEEVLANARFGMDNEDWGDEEDEEEDDEDSEEDEQAHAEDVDIAQRLSVKWINAGYPSFYYDGGDDLQFDYEPAENASYIGKTEDITEAIADIRFLVHRKQYNVAMWVSAGGLPRRVELFFRGRIPPMSEIREIEEDLITGIVGLKHWRPEKQGSVYDESEVDRERIDKLNRYWEKAGCPPVKYYGSDRLEFNPVIKDKPTFTMRVKSFKHMLFVVGKIYQTNRWRYAFVGTDANFNQNHIVYFFKVYRMEEIESFIRRRLNEPETAMTLEKYSVRDNDAEFFEEEPDEEPEDEPEDEDE
jgi:hypothetical protein